MHHNDFNVTETETNAFPIVYESAVCASVSFFRKAKIGFSVVAGSVQCKVRKIHAECVLLCVRVLGETKSFLKREPVRKETFLDRTVFEVGEWYTHTHVVL